MGRRCPQRGSPQGLRSRHGQRPRVAGRCRSRPRDARDPLWKPPAELEVPDSQSFNSGILDAIEEEKVTPFVAPAAAKASRLPWAIAAAACVAAASTFLISPGGSDTSDIRSAYTPDASIDAKVYVDEEAGATIILLDGIAKIPDEQSITPKTLISRALPGGSGSRAFFANHDGTSPSMVLTRTAGGQVRIQDVY